MTTHTKATSEQLQCARAEWPWAENEIGFDRDALVSEADPEDAIRAGDFGFWIQAWIWVPTDEPHEQTVDHT
jgi:hypothetical protein